MRSKLYPYGVIHNTMKMGEKKAIWIGRGLNDADPVLPRYQRRGS